MKMSSMMSGESPSPKEISKLKKEYSERLDLASMSDEDLYQCCVDKLKESFKNREYPFEKIHKTVDLIREEFDRRGKAPLFHKAFRNFEDS